MFYCQKIVIEKNSPRPAYIQLYDELARQIREHNPNVPAELPSERTLASLLHLNRATVHRAYEELKKSGLVERQPDKSLNLLPEARKKLEGNVPAIGLLLPDLFSSYMERKGATGIEYIKGIFDRAAKLNYAVSVLHLPPPDASPEDIKKFAGSRFSGLSGLIHLGDRGVMADPVLAAITSCTGIPQVCINSQLPACPHIGAVCCDFQRAAAEFCAHLKAANISRCGLVTTPFLLTNKSPFFEYTAGKRAALMRQYLSDSGISITPGWDGINLRSIEDLRRLIRQSGCPELIWCLNDQLALKLMEWCRELDIRIPEDLKLIGFDGIDRNSPLATFRQPFTAIGEAAVDMLLEHFEYGINADNRLRFLPAEFVPGCTL